MGTVWRYDGFVPVVPYAHHKFSVYTSRAASLERGCLVRCVSVDEVYARGLSSCRALHGVDILPLYLHHKSGPLWARSR